MTKTSRSKEPMDLDQAMHELRKAHKGMRRLQHRLMVAEGLLAKICKVTHTQLNDVERLAEARWLSSSAFYDVWKIEKCNQRYDKHLIRKRGNHI